MILKVSKKQQPKHQPTRNRDEMTEAVVKDWLIEWASLDSGQIHSYANDLQHNDELIVALQTVFEDRTKFPLLIDPICDQLFSFYRSREQTLQKFTLQLLPTLISVYLSAVACGDKKGCKSIETLLLGMYNLEVVAESGEPVVLSFRLPSLAQGSLYHEPTREAFTESALRRFEEVNTKPVTWGPHLQAEVVNAQNRIKIVTALLFIFNRRIGTFHKCALKDLCRGASRIVMQGFPRPGHHQRSSALSGETSFLPKLPSRIPISAPFLLELASGLYYAMYNDFGCMAMQAIEDIYFRSCHECYSEVILMVNAIKNSSQIAATGQAADVPMGISVPLSPPSASTTPVNKSMITNASFRTKKLPDDIPIVSGVDSNTAIDGNQLVSITEEKEEETNFTPRAASIRGKDAVTKNLQKLGIGKKPKVKTNPGDKISEKKKSIKSPVIHNGDIPDGADSPQGMKRRSTIDSSDGVTNDVSAPQTPDVLDNLDSLSLDEPIRRLDLSPSAHKKFSDIDDKPLMQVSSV